MSDVSKLPKWAQQRINKLEADVAYWRRQANVGPEDSDTFRHEYGPGGENAGQPLGRGARIRFDLDDDAYILASLKDGVLDLHGSSRCASSLLVRPVASNAVRVRLDR